MDMGGGGGMGGGGMTTDAAEGWEGAKLGVCTLEPVGPREACNTKYVVVTGNRLVHLN